MDPQAEPYILLVEDDPDVAAVYAIILESEGYRVKTACDGLDALRVLRDGPGRPALLVTDLMMPRMAGDELCRRTAADPAWSNVPVLVVSAVADRMPALPGCRVKAVLPKPLSFETLLDLVRVWGGPARRDGAAGGCGTLTG